MCILQQLIIVLFNYIFQNQAKRIRDKSKSAITLQCTLAKITLCTVSLGRGKRTVTTLNLEFENDLSPCLSHHSFL